MTLDPPGRAADACGSSSAARARMTASCAAATCAEGLSARSLPADDLTAPLYLSGESVLMWEREPAFKMLTAADSKGARPAPALAPDHRAD